MENTNLPSFAVKEKWTRAPPQSLHYGLGSAKVLCKEDLYKLQFITLDSQSTIRKVIDHVLVKADIDLVR